MRNDSVFICASEKCWKEHSKLPYKWEVEVEGGWSALPGNEEVEKDFCDPSNEYR